jgi:hypothetical protein
MSKKRQTSSIEAEQHGIEHIASYYKELQLCLREHESKFDNAVLLVGGGAFTISAAFISDLDPPLSVGMALAISWLSWGLCLVIGVGGHLVGAHATKRVLALLDAEEYDVKVLTSGHAAKFIRPLNIATFVLLIVGFIAFGWFTFINLDFGGRHGDEDARQVSKAEERQQETGWRSDEGAQHPVAGAAMATPQTNVPEVRTDHGRQEDAATNTRPTAAAAADSEIQPRPADTGKADSTHDSEPAAGMAPAG